MHPCRWGQTPSPPQPCPRSVGLLSRPLSELRPVETRRLDVTPEGFPCAVAMGGDEKGHPRFPFSNTSVSSIRS